MGAREKRSVHDVERLEKLVPSITSECSFGQDVSELALGVDVCQFASCDTNSTGLAILRQDELDLTSDNSYGLPRTVGGGTQAGTSLR